MSMKISRRGSSGDFNESVRNAEKALLLPRSHQALRAYKAMMAAFKVLESSSPIGADLRTPAHQIYALRSRVANLPSAERNYSAELRIFYTRVWLGYVNLKGHSSDELQSLIVSFLERFNDIEDLSNLLRFLRKGSEIEWRRNFCKHILKHGKNGAEVNALLFQAHKHFDVVYSNRHIIAHFSSLSKMQIFITHTALIQSEIQKEWMHAFSLQTGYMNEDDTNVLIAGISSLPGSEEKSVLIAKTSAFLNTHYGDYYPKGCGTFYIEAAHSTTVRRLDYFCHIIEPFAKLRVDPLLIGELFYLSRQYADKESIDQRLAYVKSVIDWLIKMQLYEAEFKELEPLLKLIFEQGLTQLVECSERLNVFRQARSFSVAVNFLAIRFEVEEKKRPFFDIASHSILVTCRNIDELQAWRSKINLLYKECPEEKHQALLVWLKAHDCSFPTSQALRRYGTCLNVLGCLDIPLDLEHSDLAYSLHRALDSYYSRIDVSSEEKKIEAVIIATTVVRYPHLFFLPESSPLFFQSVELTEEKEGHAISVAKRVLTLRKKDVKVAPLLERSMWGGISFNFEQIRLSAQTFLVPKESVPEEINHAFWIEMTTTLKRKMQSEGQQEIEGFLGFEHINRWEDIETGCLSHPFFRSLFTLYERLSVEQLHFFSILKMLTKLSREPKEGQVLSERESMLLRFFINVVQCTGRKREGLAAFYENVVPIESRLSPDSATSGGEARSAVGFFVSSHTQSFLAGQFASEAFIRDITGKRDHPEPHHQSVYCKNVIAKEVGLDCDYRFDVHGGYVSPQLFGAKKEHLIATYQKYTKPSALIVYLQQRFNAMEPQERAVYYNHITDLWSETKSEDYWNFTDSGITITLLTMFHILLKLNYIKQES